MRPKFQAPAKIFFRLGLMRRPRAVKRRPIARRLGCCFAYFSRCPFTQERPLIALRTSDRPVAAAPSSRWGREEGQEDQRPLEPRRWQTYADRDSADGKPGLKQVALRPIKTGPNCRWFTRISVGGNQYHLVPTEKTRGTSDHGK
jgi:hypothetical protein